MDTSEMRVSSADHTYWYLSEEESGNIFNSIQLRIWQIRLLISSLVEYCQVIGVFEVLRIERYVEVKALPGVEANMIKVGLSEVGPVLPIVVAMDGRVEDPGIVVELVLRPLAVVDVKVDDEHLGHVQV